MGLPRPVALADADLARLLDRRSTTPPEVAEAVVAILDAVRAGGDAALRDATRRFDAADLADPWLAAHEWQRLADDADPDVVAALAANMARIESFHAQQVGAEQEMEVAPGIHLGRRPVPYRRVACYVPGGRASYPSTVLMTVVPARLAGVQDIIVVTPPRPDGSIDPAVAAAARLAGAHRILRAGGAQAIAALAFGTDAVTAVDAIVGPGNQYVTVAKQRVAAAGYVHADAPAGPSELLVLADGSADPGHVASDLMAQAEHDPDAQVVLVTDDAALAAAVSDELATQAADAPRREIIEQSLSAHGAILVAADWAQAVGFADVYAPEHLEIISKDPRRDLASIHNAGSVFLGPWAPVSLGDYGSGTNHVLPTMGLARLRGGLCLDDFRKWITWQDVNRQGLAAVADDITRVADAEGLHGHADAVRRRLQ